MKTKIPGRIATVCDFCRRETSVLTTCVICGKEYCMFCEVILAGCVDQPDVCKRCGEHDKVRETVDRFAPKFLLLLQARSRALKRIKVKK